MADQHDAKPSGEFADQAVKSESDSDPVDGSRNDESPIETDSDSTEFIARMKRDDEETWHHPLGNARELAGIGIEIVASIIGLGAVGWLIDRWAGTMPVAMAVGLILGVIGGMYNAVKKALRITGASPYDHEERKRETEHPKDDG